MPDRDDTLNMQPQFALADALRALPDAAAPADLWPAITHTLARRQQRARAWRRALPAALAAAVALAVLLPPLARRAPAPSFSTAQGAAATSASQPAAMPAPGAEAELGGLRERSQTLERWVAAVSARAPQDSRDLMAAVEIEDLIGLVDVQLGASRNHADALPLWRQRVALLEDLATVRGSAFAIAATDNLGMPAADPSLRIN